MTYKIHFSMAMISFSAMFLMAFMFFLAWESKAYYLMPLDVFAGVWNWFSYKGMMELYHRNKP